MLNVIHMFREQDTRDELGIASVRDAYADYFFPGITTIQTRAKYMLFVPWIYRGIEGNPAAPAKIAEKARKEEIRLISCLKENNQTEGLIGMYAGASLQRLPSSIYWYGLLSWSIRLFPGSIYNYHHYIPTYQRKLSEYRYRRESPEELIKPNWHPGIPPATEDFPEGAVFALTAEEAEYLRERIMTSHEASFLARLVSSRETADAAHLWDHPAAENVPGELKAEIERSRCFAETIHGAALLYNYMLAEKRGDTSGMEKFSGRIETWAELIETRRGEITSWAAGLNMLWSTPPLLYRRIHPFTKKFIENWTNAAVNKGGYSNITGSREGRELLLNRELMLKNRRARLRYPRALELWSGDSGSGMLDYRWHTVKTIAADIVSGLAGEEAAHA